MHLDVHVCLSVRVISRKQEISKTDLRIFAKFTADTLCMLPWKRVASGADLTQDVWE